MTKRYYLPHLEFYFIAILVLFSCAPQPPTQTLVATNEICPPATLIPIPPTKTPLSPPILTHYFILIDRSGSYYSTVEDVINLLEETLHQILQPGDRITIAWISSVSGKSTENIFDGVVPEFLENENLEPMILSPQPDNPILLEIPSSTPGTTMHEMQETQTAQSIILENQERINHYNCDVREWNKSLEEKIIPAETPTASNQGYLFMEDVIKSMETAKLTPLSTATDVYGALWDVSQSFSVGRGTNQFQRFKLIIFSDLVDTQKQVNLPINLTNVDVLVAWFECEDPEDCNWRQQYWGTKLLDAGSNTVAYLRERESTTQNLVSLLSR